MADECRYGGPTKGNGNCTEPGDDGLPVQCVGPWAEEKHDYLARYIDATWAVRRKYLAPHGDGGAAFVDLFSGPGRARLRNSGRQIDGSPIIALKHAKAPFTKVIACEVDADNVAALRARTEGQADRFVLLAGDCRSTIDDVIRAVPLRGLNIALVDPFGLEALDFQTIAKLTRFARMDLLIHFPTMAIRRNWDQGARQRLPKAIGKETMFNNPSDAGRVIDEFRASLSKLGYTGSRIRSIPVKAGEKVLYHLMFASKDEKGDAIWQSITKTLASGQRALL